MESVGETCELEQLVPSDAENEDSAAQDYYNSIESKVVTPVKSNKISSSGATSHSSLSRRIVSQSNESKIAYVNEKKPNKDYNKQNTFRPRNAHKVANSSSRGPVRHHCFLSEVPDVRHMEQALIGLLDDFHSGKLRAFGKGSTMEQMTDIREQQEKLAKLHFDLVATNEPSLGEEGLKHSQNTMGQLIERLEQLSESIEGLHNSKGE